MTHHLHLPRPGFLCMPLKDGVENHKPRIGVADEVYLSEVMLEHPAIPRLMLSLEERLYGGCLEIWEAETGEVCDETLGEVRDETLIEMFFRQKWYPPSVGINFNVLSLEAMLSDIFSQAEKEILVDGFKYMRGCIFDDYNNMSPYEICLIRRLSIQYVFNEMGKIIPFIIFFLHFSMEEHGEEAVFETFEFNSWFEQHNAFPKLLLTDGRKVFSLLQAAALTVGLSDENIRLWYSLLILLMETNAEEKTALVH